MPGAANEKLDRARNRLEGLKRQSICTFHKNFRRSNETRLQACLMANFVTLGLDLSSTLKAQAQHRLKNFGLFPPLIMTLFLIIIFDMFGFNRIIPVRGRQSRRSPNLSRFLLSFCGCGGSLRLASVRWLLPDPMFFVKL